MVTATRSNSDYSGTAIKLVNPPKVEELLTKIEKVERKIAKAERKIEEATPIELIERLEQLGNERSFLDIKIRKAIDKYGSFQDTKTGRYALKRVITYISYDAERLKRLFPNIYGEVVKEVVDKDALEKLVKKGRLNNGKLKRVQIRDESIRYLISVGGDGDG